MNKYFLIRNLSNYAFIQGSKARFNLILSKKKKSFFSISFDVQVYLPTS